MDCLFPDSILLIFCKAPIPGQVKTRLMPALSLDGAVNAHIALAQMTLERAFQQPLCPVRLYCWPDTEHPFFKQCARNYPLTLTSQQGADLGERMLNAFIEALHDHRHAILIGCDCPSLTIGDLQQALTALQNGHDTVFAPAEDGGYVLVGLNAPQPVLFKNMTWGTQSVMAETRIRADQAKLNLYALNTQWDVDDIEDWKRFASKNQTSQPTR